MPRDALTSDTPVLVAPSILSADFAHLASDCAQVLHEGGADLLHVDVMDGHFVPNLTLGPALVASLRAALPDACLDVHVMVTDPGQYIGPFAEAGADHLTFHIEPATDVRAGAGMAPLSEGYDPLEIVTQIKDAGMTAGLAINPGTPLEDAMRVIDRGVLDMVLVMSVRPGFGGQAFIDQTLETTRAVRDAVGPYASSGVRVEMDGGIKAGNARACREAGCDVLVAGSAVFGLPPAERAGVIGAIRSG